MCLKWLIIGKSTFDAEMHWIVLSQDLLYLRLVVISVTDDLNVDSFAPVRDQLEGLLAYLLDLSEIQIILGDDEAQVNQVTQTFRDA